MKNKRKYGLIISIIVFIVVIAFAIYAFLYKKNVSNFKLLVLNLGILIVISIISIINQLKAKKNESNILSSLMILIFVGCTFFLIKGTTFKEVAKMPNFIGKDVNEAILWASSNNIELLKNYEYSDNYKEAIIFAQDVPANSELTSIKNVSLTISSGFDYNKLVILSSYVGQDIDTFLSETEALHLNNVKIKYEVNEYNERNIIVSQSKTGEVRRNDEIEFVVSLGQKADLGEVKMISLIDKNLFDATLFLEQNGIDYELKYEFSERAKDTVIDQSIAEDEIVKPLSTKIVLTISKGNKIIVPNLIGKTTTEVIKWISDNNLKLSLTDAYNSSIEAGLVISANYKENDEVAEGTTIEIVTSKGALKMLSFSSLSEFRSWANTYGIKYEEEYEFNNTISKGNIIKFSLSPNDLIDEDTPIIVTISNGKAVTIPNYVGKTKTEITSSCKSIGLNCTFNYGAYSTKAKDTATSQNKKAGSTVMSGTSLVITLSKGTAKTFTVEISESQLTIGNANKTIETLKKYFAQKYPDVTFTFSTKKSNVYSNAGFIHENSPVNDGKKVTQGNKYNVIITK